MRLLDLFCGAGGAAVGYQRAGFTDIVGVDIVPQPNYPFTFIQADALKPPVDLERFDLVHASPPCQGYTPLSNRWGSRALKLIGAVRDLIGGTSGVIENVRGAKKEMVSPVELTGEMFGLGTHRPRLFELVGWMTLVPAPPRRSPSALAVYGPPDGRRLITRVDGTELKAWDSLEAGQTALGVPWIGDWHAVKEAIPPAYTQFLGEQFLNQ